VESGINYIQQCQQAYQRFPYQVLILKCKTKLSTTLNALQRLRRGIHIVKHRHYFKTSTALTMLLAFENLLKMRTRMSHLNTSLLLLYGQDTLLLLQAWSIIPPQFP
jgi:hypothetical protein